MGIETEIDGSPGSIRAAASWLSGSLAPALDHAVDALAGVRNDAGGDWRGETGTAFTGAVGRALTHTDPVHARATGLATTLEDYAGSLASCQARMAAIRDDARSAGLTVAGTVVQEPGPAPADPGPPPEVASQGEVASYEARVAAWNHHQELVGSYNRLAERADGVWSDVQRAWERVAAEDRAFGASDWAFNLSDVSGGLGGAVAETHVSLLRGNARYFKDLADENLQRLAERVRVGPGGSTQFYDDVEHYTRMGSSADEALESAGRLGRVAKIAPTALGGALAVGGIYYDFEYGGESLEQAAASNLGGFAASVGTGALIGTAIGGPVGTAVGAVVGAGVGVFTSGMIDGLFEYDGDVSDAFMAGVDTVVDTGEALADVGGAIVDGIGGLFD